MSSLTRLDMNLEQLLAACEASAPEEKRLPFLLGEQGIVPPDGRLSIVSTSDLEDLLLERSIFGRKNPNAEVSSGPGRREPHRKT